MTVLVAGEALPSLPVPPPQQQLLSAPYVGMRQTWTGWDGSVFALTDPRSPVRMKRGVRGLKGAPYEPWLQRAPGLAGTRYRGGQWDELPVTWPVGIAEAPGQPWLDVDRAFWRTLHPERPGTWTVHTPDGRSRSITLRFRGHNDHGFEGNPTGIGYARYSLSFAAERPFWEGEPYVDEWGPAEQDPPLAFPDEPTDPYVMYLASGRTFADAVVSNTGDVPSYPAYRLAGPFANVTVGLAGLPLVVPFGLGVKESVLLDTDPEVQSAIREDGTDVTRLLGARAWAPVPPGESVPLAIEMVGRGRVGIVLPTLHLSAW